MSVPMDLLGRLRQRRAMVLRLGTELPGNEELHDLHVLVRLSIW